MVVGKCSFLSYRVFRSRTYNTLLAVNVEELFNSEILCDSFGNSNLISSISWEILLQINIFRFIFHSGEY